MPSLLNATITTAAAGVVTTPVQFLRMGGVGPRNLLLQAKLTYGSGGTSADFYVQTTIDGTNWIDIAQFHFTTASATKVFNLSLLTPVTTSYTPTDGALAADTAKDGVIGSQLRVKYTTVGTYAGGTTIAIDAVTSQLRPQTG